MRVTRRAAAATAGAQVTSVPSKSIRETGGAGGEATDAFASAISSLVDFPRAHELFHLFNRIAVLRYEDLENNGNLLLCDRESALPQTMVQFDEPFNLNDGRGVRKYLQITDRKLCLLSDCYRIFGFAMAGPKHLGFTVRFRRAGIWQLVSGGKVILEVKAPSAVSSRAVRREDLLRKLHETFDSLTDKQSERLFGLIDAAAHQLRGTNVLISADAAGEAARLGTQCTRIEPIPFRPDLIERFTTIDGTVLLDTNGVCHAVGAILDGRVSGYGDRVRGGRYNSAVMYVHTSQVPSLIVVISRDRTIDIVSSHTDAASRIANAKVGALKIQRSQIK